MAMKLGTENKKKVIIAAVLGVVVLALLIWDLNRMVFSSPSTPPSPATSSASSSGAGSSSGSGSNSGQAKSVPVSLSKLDPTLHPGIMAQAESIRYTGSGRNIFSMNSAPPSKIEAVKGPVRPAHHQIAKGPTGPPPPPAIPLQFFGYEARGSSRRAFLIHGHNIYIASEGDVVDHRYKVIKILPSSIEVTDLLYNHTQSLPLERS